MKPRTVFILVALVVFFSVVALALLREVEREEAMLERAISGIAEVSEAMLGTGQADIARTDRLALLLVDPKTGEAVALKTISPFVPPMTISIGQQDVRGDLLLDGSYYVMGITDKDGDIAKPTRGEVFGRSPEPVRVGQERIHLLLDQPFRGQVPPLAGNAGPSTGGRGSRAPTALLPRDGVGREVIRVEMIAAGFGTSPYAKVRLGARQRPLVAGRAGQVRVESQPSENL